MPPTLPTRTGALPRPSLSAWRRDERGQMMLLSAVVLIIAFVALTGMVARTSQLGKETARERSSPTINGVEPMLQGANNTINALVRQSSTPASVTSATSTTVFYSVGLSGDKQSTWVNSYVLFTSGANKGLLRSITAYANGTAAGAGFTLGSALTATPAAGDQFRLVRQTQAQLIQDNVRGALRSMQGMQATQGYLMSYQIKCTSQANLGQALLTLDDGTVQATVRSVTFPRPAADACATVTG